MTAEERMAYFYGEKRRGKENIKKVASSNEKKSMRVRFFVCMLLFVFFLALDYGDYKIKEIGSREIMKTVREDISGTEKLQDVFSNMQSPGKRVFP